jgi:hypothetical protein
VLWGTALGCGVSPNPIGVDPNPSLDPGSAIRLIYLFCFNLSNAFSLGSKDL